MARLRLKLCTGTVGSSGVRRAIGRVAVLVTAATALVAPSVVAGDAAPLNANFASAQTLSGASGSTTGTIVAATSEPGEPQIGSGMTIWYRWDAPASGPATIDTFGSNFDTVLAVYTGTSLSNLSLVASNDDYSHLLQSRVDFGATSGTSYYIQVDGFLSSPDTGSVVLNWLLGSVVPPAPTIDSSPPALTSSTTATFTFSDAQAGVSFRCSLDLSAYSACTSPQSYSGLADGLHTFLVAGTNDDQLSEPASFTWTVDTTPPPVPSIDSHPDAATSSTSASFTFSDAEAAATFICSLDGAAYSACTSPQSYTDLAEGQHSFAVKAKDSLGNASAATTFNWTIDLTPPPAPTIGSHPDAATNSTSASFTFSDADATAGFLCSLDGASYTACTSPKSYSGLAEGQHAFSVYAKDPAGNASSATSFTWTIDLTPPSVPTITSSPDPGTTSTNASFTFSDAEPGVTFICKLDGSTYAACTSPQSYSGLTDGQHTFSVAAKDAVGNVSAAATFTWTIDTNARPTVMILSHPDLVTSSTTATFTFFVAITRATYYCSLDGGAFSVCTSPKTYSGLSGGQHTFAVKAKDLSGIFTEPTTFTWTTDTTPRPAPVILSHPDLVTSSTSATFTFSDTMVGASFYCSLDGAAYGACTSPKTYTNLAEGEHTFAVYAQDLLGIKSDPTIFTWTIDLTPPPAPTIDSHPDAVTNAISASLTFSDAESGSTFLCSLDGAAYTACTSPQSYSNLGQGQHTFAVKARDAAGNVSGATTFTWTIDLTPPPAPAIDSHPDTVTSSPSATFTFSDAEAGVSFLCSLDGAAYTACTSPQTYSNLHGTHTFVVYAKDPAGNLSVSVSFTWSDPAGAKRTVLTTLQAMVPSGDIDTAMVSGGGLDADGKLREAIRNLQDSLDGSLWLDGSHLQSRGEKVFQKEEECVVKLRDVIGNTQTSLDKSKLRSAILSMVSSDRVLAKTLSDDATAAGGLPGKLAEARTELANGDASAAAGMYMDAIDHYKNAWKDAWASTH